MEKTEKEGKTGEAEKNFEVYLASHSSQKEVFLTKIRRLERHLTGQKERRRRKEQPFSRSVLADSGAFFWLVFVVVFSLFAAGAACFFVLAG